MKIITIYFERKKQYKKFLTVFQNSIKKVMPNAEVEIIKIDMPKNIDHKRDTAFAFLAAARYVLRANELIAVADVDLMFEKSIEDIQSLPFDIAVTTRSKMKYNTGLWFYRPTQNARKFVKKWIGYTKIIVDDFCKYEGFSWDNGGIDQASLAWAIRKNKICKILELPCQEWNATQSEWKCINKRTRVIHIKSKLRLAALKRIIIGEEHKYLKPLVERWKSYL